jgi:hypothetical protein
LVAFGVEMLASYAPEIGTCGQDERDVTGRTPPSI